MKSNANEPIAPVLAQSANSYEAVQYMGLTKREYFAAMAMQGMAMRVTSLFDSEVAASAVALADALIAELERTK